MSFTAPCDLVGNRHAAGARVVDESNGALGEIREIISNRHTGRIAFAVVAFCQIRELEGRLFAVPFDCLSYSLGADEYRLWMPKTRLRAMLLSEVPRFFEYFEDRAAALERH